MKRLNKTLDEDCIVYLVEKYAKERCGFTYDEIAKSDLAWRVMYQALLSAGRIK